MSNNTKDQPGRAQPNESEDQPSKRQAGFDDQRKDEVPSPPIGGDPERETGEEEEQVERKSADQSPNPEIRKS